MRRRSKVFAAFAVIIGCIWLFNASFLAATPDGTLTLMSHRGVHQEFEIDGIENDTCTAERIFPPTHNYVENTLPSMQAAIEYGADMIELDIHPTTDGEFAVFHDWTLECRTNGIGRVRDQSSDDLKTLDVGYGYTADKGQTFPFRGQHIGAMPMLGESLEAFPETRFLINIKSRSTTEGRLLVEYLAARDVPKNRFVVYGHQDPINTIEALNPDIVTMGKRQAKDCLIGYVATGWFGRMPKTCHYTWVPVPENFRWFVWGWPNRFQDRLSKVGSEAVLVGPQTSARSNPAIDTVEQLQSIPTDFSGTVWTNRIEIVGPLLVEPSEKLNLPECCVGKR